MSFENGYIMTYWCWIVLGVRLSSGKNLKESNYNWGFYISLHQRLFSDGGDFFEYFVDVAGYFGVKLFEVFESNWVDGTYIMISMKWFIGNVPKGWGY